MSFHRPTTVAAVAIIVALACCGALAQTSPPSQAGQADYSVFPPVGNPPTANVGHPATNPLQSDAASYSANQCAKEYAPLRDEAERRGKLIKEASERHAGPEEACKLIGSYAQAESKMISFVETHATACAIPIRVMDQLKSGHQNTEALQTKVCNVAQQMQRKGLPAGPVGDFYLRDDVSKRQPVGPVGDFDPVR